MNRIAIACASAVLALSGCLHQAPAQAPPPSGAGRASSPPHSKPVDTLTVPAGERIVLVLQSALHTRYSKEGDRVYFTVLEDVRAGDRVAVPRDSRIHATVTKVRRPGRIRGKAEIQFRFDELLLAGGSQVPFHAAVLRAGFARTGETEGGDAKIKGDAGKGGTAGVIAQGGIQGATIGIMTRSVKAAGYGAAAGAAVGAVSVMLERGPELDLPRSTLFEVETEDPLEVPVAARAAAAATSASDANRKPPFVVNARKEIEVPPAPPRPRLRRPDGAAAGVPEGKTQPEPAATSGGEPKASPPPDRYEPAGTPGYKLSVDVQLVTVEAVVRDRAGQLMNGLKQQDFHVWENGVEQTVTNFSRDQLPLAVALVIDRSGSVQPYMHELRQSAYRALSELKDEDKVALFSFATDIERMEDLTTDRRRIAERIGDIQAGGSTNIMDAIFDAVNYLGMVAPERRHAVILISDNQATVKPHSDESQTIRMALETQTVVYSLRTSGEGLPPTMQLPRLLAGFGSVDKVARETGGEVIDVRNSGGIGFALQAAMERLRLRYTLGYSPGAPFQDDSFRRIEVRLGPSFGQPGSDYRIYARRGYYPPLKRRTRNAQP